MTDALDKRFGLNGKVALVTGGGQGIGRAAGLALAEAGASVAVVDLNLEQADQVAAAIREQGGQAIAIRGDVTEPGTIESMMKQTTDELGRLDILINNAGIYPFSDFLETSDDVWNRVVDLNLTAVFRCSRTAGQIMADQGGGGCIVNLASVQGLKPTNGGLVPYDTTKAAVVMLTKATALELGPHQIRVNAIAPGVVPTPGTRDVLSETEAVSVQRTPMGHLGTAEDVANTILFLASPAACFITGETIAVDGGYVLT
ncbi:MAG: SDR family oxidoreductase [Kiritimatiellia bacterium]|jgi:NAD(P)-dependent dehydrogenase (short-subunit alcohol dehydrogenase family)|nr:SDR family oxidoreductase [Pseudomonadales bacterium]MDP6473260.1 SDR family oxidoreductase [Pseudomonadales bacterium]MDP6829185.1 SDR family oxidoreductase [Pseudomonadales bacterium]MDP7023160.1 SDR family oxidoreductase [Kiritimatiellia bacterium]